MLQFLPLCLLLPCLFAQSPANNQESQPGAVYTAITVTATLGRQDDAATSPSVALVRDERDLSSRPLATIGEVLEGAPGVLVQKTSTSQVSPFLRGLTGYQVLNLIDGIRFNNSTFRSGPNQYLALVEPLQASRLEATLGPAGALYGSDTMGGSIQLLTAAPRFSASTAREWRGEFSLFGGTADLSGGARAQVSTGTARASWLAGGSLRRHNDLRGGAAADSRHAFRRFFGLNDSAIGSLTGSRMRDTAFTQSGAHTKLSLRLDESQSFTAWYQFSEQTGADNYKDLWGGLGRLESRLEPQRLHFAYARYERLAVAGLDRLSGTFSVNSQADGTRRQALRITDPAVEDHSRVDALGYSAQGAKEWSRGPALIFGADLYDERIGSYRLQQSAVARPLYPDGSRYRTSGLYAQGAREMFGNRLRALAGSRLTRVSFQTVEDPRFGVPRTGQTFHDVTMNGSLTWRASSSIQIHALGGRGFRAPNLNDLGAVGLNDLGYEIPASEAPFALMGANAAESALPTGKPVRGLRAESLWNAETGVTVQARRVYFRVNGFHADLIDPIVRRTLLFPLDALPARLAGLPVAANAPTPQQAAAGVATVSTALDPRGVKAFVNDGQARYKGLETLARVEFTRAWRLDAGYSYIDGRELYPTRNIRRLPPRHGFAAIRWTGNGRRPWLEFRADAAGAQHRLSGGDLDDERIGAARSRRDIASFFAGARVAPYLTADGRFAPTGETLAQIQDRVLPLAVAGSETARVPLYAATSGWASLGLRGGLPLNERWSVMVAFENLADRNYRLHGSGTDAPGMNAWAALRWAF